MRREGRPVDVLVNNGGLAQFGAEGCAETLRRELRGCGVEVAPVGPGAFRTGIRDSPLPALEPPESSPYAADFVRPRAFYLIYIDNHLGDPDRVARVVARVAAGRPGRLRHPGGVDAWTQIALRAALPWRLRERVARALVGLRP
ncbi:hypothetical protein [Streptomyces sp. NPDC055299]